MKHAVRRKNIVDIHSEIDFLLNITLEQWVKYQHFKILYSNKVS